MRRPRSRALLVVTAGLVLAAAGWATAKTGTDTAGDDPPLAEVKSELVVLGTPDGRYIALVPELDSRHVYFGERRALHRQKVLLTATDEDDNFSVLIWAPDQVGGGAIEMVEDRWRLRCGARITDLVAVGENERALLLKTARFEAPRLAREPYALARNERGEYFYIDRDVRARGSAGYRMYTGRIGKVRQIKLAWVVSDSEGDVFAGRRGQLRVVTDERGGRSFEWRRGKSVEALLEVPIARNPYLVYKELGVYQNHQLGTPCDGP
jgi:hypothetical protein